MNLEKNSAAENFNNISTGVYINHSVMVGLGPTRRHMPGRRSVAPWFTAHNPEGAGRGPLRRVDGPRCPAYPIPHAGLLHAVLLYARAGVWVEVRILTHPAQRRVGFVLPLISFAAGKGPQSQASNSISRGGLS